MDAPRGLNEQQADAALRDLFREAGTTAAPDHLEAAILERIAGDTARAAVKPLLPRWTWLVGIAMCLALVILYGKNGASPSWMPQTSMPAEVGRFFTSAWLRMGLACGALLLALHLWLERRLTAAHG